MSRTPADPAGGPVVERLAAFGLELEAGFELPGAVAGTGGRAGATRLSLAADDELREMWRPAAPERLSDRRTADGRTVITIDADPVAGHLVDAAAFGRFWVSPGAEEIRCAPRPMEAWRWQRYLFGHVLPLAAAVRGIEIFHASAVVLGGRAVAFLGASTAGKTSIAASLALRGARFLTDDVLAVRPESGARPLAHPGATVISLRPEPAAALDPAGLRRLGRTLGRDSEGLRIAVDRHEAPVPLTTLYLLERDPGDGRTRAEAARPLDPRALLAATFNFVIRTPERLVRQLDVCAAIAAGADVRRLVIPRSESPADVADAVLGIERAALA